MLTCLSVNLCTCLPVYPYLTSYLILHVILSFMLSYLTCYLILHVILSYYVILYHMLSYLILSYFILHVIAILYYMTVALSYSLSYLMCYLILYYALPSLTYYFILRAILSPSRSPSFHLTPPFPPTLFFLPSLVSTPCPSAFLTKYVMKLQSIPHNWLTAITQVSSFKRLYYMMTFSCSYLSQK